MAREIARQAHNLKVRGSNPLPATGRTLYINRLPEAPDLKSGASSFVSELCPKNAGRRASLIVPDAPGNRTRSQGCSAGTVVGAAAPSDHWRTVTSFREP